MRARRPADQAAAYSRQQEAMRQRNLLLQTNVSREESDFYPYRYLASEGFLPDYNFPALPVRAWVPREEGEFINRPRFLALREFCVLVNRILEVVTPDLQESDEPLGFGDSGQGCPADLLLGLS